jgi:hypothetical protein
VTEGRPDSNSKTPHTQQRPALGRRGFVLAGAPIILTLANRPALASGKKGGGGFVCSMSILASANLSNPVEAGANCGVSPGCWKNRAYDESGTKLWESTGYTPTQTVGDVFPPPAPSATGKWKWSDPNKTLHQALGSDPPKLGYKYGSNSTNYNSGNGVINEIIAGFLNANAFNGGHLLFGMVMNGHYPYSPGEITGAFSVLWAKTPSSESGVTSAVWALRNAVYQVEDSAHFCDPAM